MNDEGERRLSPSSFIVHLSSLLLFIALSFQARALEIPPKPVAWITDYAHLLTPEQQQALNEKCEAFYRATKASIVVVTFPSLEGQDPVEFTNRVVNGWKVKGDRIVVLFVFAKERQMRFQVGYGLESELTDAFTSDVYRNTLVPAFRAGRYYEGINEAIDRLAKKVDPNWSPPATTAPASDTVTSRRIPRDRSNSGSLGAINVIIGIAFLLFIFLVVLPAMRRGGGCVGCFPGLPFGGGWGGGGWGGGGTTFGGGDSGGGGGGGGWSIGGNWGGGDGSSFGGGGSGGGW